MYGRHPTPSFPAQPHVRPDIPFLAVMLDDVYMVLAEVFLAEAAKAGAFLEHFFPADTAERIELFEFKLFFP